MAQTNYTPISLYYSATASATPTAGNLVAGELALNTNDGKLFYKDSSGVVQTLASKAGNVNVSSFSAGTTGLTPSTASTGAVTLAGTLNVANGGTGVTTSTGSGNVVLSASPTLTGTVAGASLSLSSLTSGRVTYAGTSGLLQDSANLTFSGSTLTIGGTASVLNLNSSSYSQVVSAQSLYLDAGSTGAVYIRPNGSTQAAVFSSAGYLGIGTSSPVSQLQISSSGNTPMDVTSTGTGAVWTRYNTSTYYFDIGINNSAGTTFSTDAYANVLWGANNYPTVFGTNNTERMRLTTAGYLGIGTSSPSYTLDVTGVARVLSNNQSDGILINGNDNNNVKIRMANSGSGGQEWQMQIGQQSANNFNYVLRCNTTSTNVLFADSSGNLGLGVTPSAWRQASSNEKVIQVTNTALYNQQGGGASVGMLLNNSYFNASNQYIYNQSYAASKYAMDAGTHQWFTAPSGTAGNAITFTQAMTLDNSGRLGVGTTSPNSFLHVKGGNNNIANLDNAGAQYTNLGFSNNGTEKSAIYWDNTNTLFYLTAEAASSQMVFATAATEKARIDSSGNFLVGQTSLLGNGGGGTINAIASTTTGNHFLATSNASFADSLLVLKTTAKAAASTYNWCYFLDNGNNAQFYVRGDGVVFARNTSIQSISDERVKENIVDAQDGLNTILSLRPVRFDYKPEYDKRKNQIGFIAQEIEKVFPDAVDVWGESDDAEKPFKSVGSSTLIPVLVKAIQEQQAIIEQLKAKVGL